MCILLVLIAYVYHNAQLRKRKVYITFQNRLFDHRRKHNGMMPIKMTRSAYEQTTQLFHYN